MPSCRFTNTYAPKEHVLVYGQTVRPLEGLDFSHGNWKVYVSIDPYDFETISNKITKAMCLKSNDIQLFQKMQEEWEFVYTGGDVATVQSAIYFINNGRIVFQSEIVLDKGYEGLQSSEYGWLRAEEPLLLSEHIKEFKKVWWPFVN